MARYQGSEFHTTVQQYLATTNLGNQEPFKDKHRSKFHQESIREAKLGYLGPGRTFGETDAYRKRAYMYTLRTASRQVLYYTVEASAFIVHIKSIGLEKVFKAWRR